MKKYLASMLVVTCLGAFSWAQAPRDLFDVKKSQEELEIMKGILGTTLSFVSQNLVRQAASAGTTKPAAENVWGSSYRFSNITAYYLVGQGAVFHIPSSSFPSFSNILFADSLKATEFALVEAQAELARGSYNLAAAAGGVSGGVAGGVQGGVAGGASGGQAAKPAKPAAPTAPQDPEELRKKLAEQVIKAKKSREAAAVNREKFLKVLGEIKVYLIEALASYGDFLTTVKPNEYVNIVITSSGDNLGGIYYGGKESRRDVISVQRSVISDYKAGRLTLDAFKQKVLQYQQ
jgi:hypothetical protein